MLVIVAAGGYRTYRSRLTPTIVMAVVLMVDLLVAAPISEGRYGLFILICGKPRRSFIW